VSNKSDSRSRVLVDVVVYDKWEKEHGPQSTWELIESVDGFHPNQVCLYFNPLLSEGNYSATSNNMKLVHWPLMDGLLHLVQQGVDWAATQAPPRCTKCNSPLIIGHWPVYQSPYFCIMTVAVRF